MSATLDPNDRADFGLDAPGVVRNFLVLAIVSLLLYGSVVGGLWSGRIGRLDISGMALAFFLTFAFTGGLMVWSSKVGKIKDRDRLLSLVPWKGDESVLDVGCGRGLLLIGAAKRLTTGRAIGVDIWQSEDLSDNKPEATLENARREGVTDRVELKTADMRELPFEANSFDVVLSSWAIHNLYDARDRDKTIGEIARVMKPGSVAIIKDIRHIAQYENRFRACGCGDIRRIGSLAKSAITMIFTFGSLRPGTLMVRKSLP